MKIRIKNHDKVYVELNLDEESKTSEIISEINGQDGFLNAIINDDFSYRRVHDFIRSRTSKKSGTLEEMLEYRGKTFDDQITIEMVD